MNIRIDRPSLDKKKAESNIAVIDRWIADTADKLNMFISSENANASEREKNLNQCVVTMEQIASLLVSHTEELNMISQSIAALAERVAALETSIIDIDARVTALEGSAEE